MMRRDRSVRCLALTLFAGLMSAGTLSAPALAQDTGSITGRVTDASSLAPLGEVQVYMPGTGLGGLTRQNGQFLILNVPAGTHEIRAERIGMAGATQQITVTPGGTVTVNFALQAEALGLDEIVVTGAAGASRRREIGSTIEQIDVADVPSRPTQVGSMLQAAAPGIDIMAGGGEVGQGQRIVLRGNTSVSMSNQPIIYVDGIRMMSGGYPVGDMFDESSNRGAEFAVSVLDHINPNDIERIEVIKGSAATTLYGTEASAGVIQIFTKRGAAGAPIWTAEIQQGTRWSRKFGTPEVPYLRMDPWLRNAWVQGYSASVRGGGENLQYFISGQFGKERGIQPNDASEDWGVRGNFTVTPVDGLQIQWNTSFSNVDLSQTPGGNNAQGLTLNAFRAEQNYLGSADPDVISQILDWELTNQNQRIATGATITYTPIPDLTNRLTVGYDYSLQEQRSLRPAGWVLFPPGGLLNSTYQKRLLTLDYVGTYAFDVLGLRSSFSWGGQAVGDDERLLEGWGEDFPGATNPTVNSAAIRRGAESRQKVWNAGFFFQNVFDLDNRYFLTLGLRVDGNSAFGEGFGLQMYPKASASWVISDESWWEDGWGTIKLRTAYGRSGRAPGAFDAVRTWSSIGWDGQPAFVPENVGNPELGPEVTGEFEVGLDGAWLDGRLESRLTYYHQVTTEALFEVTQIATSGFTNSQLRNVGKLENRGFEAAIDWAPVQTESWGWDLGVNLTTNESKVLDLGGTAPFQAVGGWIIEGQPIPVVRDESMTNPNEIADPDPVDDHLYGPQLPTLNVGLNTSIRMPGGLLLAATGEYRGGHHLYINPMSITRSVRSPLCYPYYVDPESSIELREGIPAIWRGRCTPSLYESGYYVWDADYFKLRSVSLTVPLGFAMPAEVSNAALTVSLDNAWMWTKEIPWMDPEMLGDQGINSAGLGSNERVPVPISLRAILRVTF